jgi:hypothetical protein
MVRVKPGYKKASGPSPRAQKKASDGAKSNRSCYRTRRVYVKDRQGRVRIRRPPQGLAVERRSPSASP